MLLAVKARWRGLIPVLGIAWSSPLSGIVELDSPRQDRESLHVGNGSLCMLLNPKTEETESF